MNRYYIDWCPRPVNSIQNRSRTGVVKLEDLSIETSNIEGDINYICRNDGFFLYLINWKNTECTDSSIFRINAAQEISYKIKIDCGHLHYYNKEMLDYPTLHHFPTLAVDPVELSSSNKITKSNFHKKLLDDKELASFQADSFKVRNESILAILMLRNQYAKIFERSKKIQTLVSNQKLFAYPLKIKVSNKTLFKWNVSRYDFKWPIFF